MLRRSLEFQFVPPVQGQPGQSASVTCPTAPPIGNVGNPGGTGGGGSGQHCVYVCWDPPTGGGTTGDTGGCGIICN